MNGIKIWNDERIDNILISDSEIVSALTVSSSLGLPILANSAIPTNSSQKGQIAYDNLDSRIMYSTGSAWISIGSGGSGGTVTNLTSGTGITLTPNPITTSGTISLSPVGPGVSSYTLASITINAQGQITAASNGSAAGGLTIGSVNITPNANALTLTGSTLQANAASPATHGVVYGKTYNDGSGDVALGLGALSAGSGGENTAIGVDALHNSNAGLGTNTAVGSGALVQLVGGSNNIALGATTGIAYNGSESNNIIIGNSGITGDNSTIRIGDTQTQCFIAGIAGATVTNITVFMDPATGQLGQHFSSKRYKTDIETLPSELSSLIYKLKPVQFTYKVKPQDGKQIGLLAEDVYEVEPRLVELNSEGLPDFVRYHDLPILLLNEIKKLKELGDERELKLREEIEYLKTRINKIIPEQKD